MASKTASGMSWHPGKNNKKTSIGTANLKMSSMNKSKKRSYKKSRGQG